MEKQFTTPANFEDVIITIDDVFVTFKFVLDQREDGSFYDFQKGCWNKSYKNHMLEKLWFTSEMADFITSNIQL